MDKKDFYNAVAVLTQFIEKADKPTNEINVTESKEDDKHDN